MSDEVFVPVVILVSGFTFVMIVASIGATVYFVAGVFKGGKKKSRQSDSDETRLIQEVHHGLMKMQKRVESLETLMLDDERTREEQFDRDLRE
jgi:phage shock protein B